MTDARASHRSIALARAALELGDRLELDDVRSRALNNIGCARINRGDAGGFDDLERSLAIGEAANSTEAYQAAGNYASMLFQMGRRSEAEKMRRRAQAISDRFGLESLERWARAHDAESAYQSGDWDEAVRILVAWLAGIETSSHYLEAPTRQIHSKLLFARDDVPGALVECDTVLELARRIEDPQVFQPALAWKALLSVETGRSGAGVEALEEMRRRWGDSYGGFAFGMLDIAWTARALGREDDVADVFARTPANLWAQAALRIVRGDLVAAADAVDRIGVVPDLAYARLRAAEQLVREGRRVAADEQLGRALAFYRSVGATRYIREGEALLAAAS